MITIIIVFAHMISVVGVKGVGGRDAATESTTAINLESRAAIVGEKIKQTTERVKELKKRMAFCATTNDEKAACERQNKELLARLDALTKEVEELKRKPLDWASLKKSTEELPTQDLKDLNNRLQQLIVKIVAED